MSDTIVACPVCKAGKANFVKDCDKNGVKSSLYECGNCATHFFHPFSNPGSAWYEGTSDYGIKDMIAPKVWRQAQKRFLERHESFPAGTAILELGCGSGEFINQAQKRGAQVYGVDFDQKGIQVAKQHFNLQNVFAMSFEEFFKKTDLPKFDYIVFFEVIEHVDDPLQFIQNAKNLLKPGGVMVASTPSRERMLCEWNSWDFPPHHLTRWNKESLLYIFNLAGLIAQYFAYVEQFMLLRGAIDGRFRSGLVAKAANNSGPRKKNMVAAKALYIAAKIKIYVLGAPAVLLWLVSPLTKYHNGDMYVELTEKSSNV